jgi:NADPH:quinone reductase-like Zn-dependent oxidoreductase
VKAIVYTQFGPPDVLQFKEVAKPTPKDHEVLIKVHAASINAADYRLMRGQPFLIRLAGYGLRTPRYPILGSDIAGRVEAIGKQVTQFKVGDEIYGDLSGSGLGGFAEYVCAREHVLALKPTGLSFEETAAVPMAAITALQGLRDKGQVQAGEKVAINGASGGVGTFAVQIAKAFGAEVTAICSTRNVELARSLGADHIIDYKQEDFTRNGKRYDVILGVNGFHPIADYKRALRENGRYIMVGGSDAQIFQAMLLGPWMSRGHQKLGNVMQKPNQDDLVYLNGLLEAGRVKPVVDRCYPLSETAEAVRYLESGQARGKVVIGM